MKSITLRYVKSVYGLAKRQTKATMKKLINKLFERLGYVPKRYKTLHEDAEFYINSHHECTLDNLTYYTIARRYEKDLRIGYTVMQHCLGDPRVWIVKFFPDYGDRAFARLLAEELCEKLNEKY